MLVGCELDVQPDLIVLRVLSKQRLLPVTHEQGTVLAQQVGAVSCKCSIRVVFHEATVVSLVRGHR